MSMHVAKHCPSCEGELPVEFHWSLDRGKVYSCEKCGAFHRLRTTFLIPFTLGLILVKILVGIVLGMTGFWAFLFAFILVSVPAVGFLLYFGLQPEAVEFGKVGSGRLKAADLHTTLH
jgi:hypothetical protein